MNLKSYIRDVEDFPIKGVIFKDITTLLENPEAFNYCINKISENMLNADKIVALDARGFIFGAAIAYKLNKPLVIVRKAGKLAFDTISEKYSLEYGESILEINIDSIKKGDKISIVDDLLATGGTAKATCNLIEKLGGEVTDINFVINLTFLSGNKLLKKYKINNLVNY